MAQTAIPTVKAQLRAEKGSRASRRIRREGRLPAVLYGHKEENIALTVEHEEIETLLKRGAHLVELSIDGNVEQALFKDIQHNAAGYGLLHVDFERVALDEEVTTTVALDFHGTPAGSTHGGVPEYHVTEIEIECLPMNIPDVIRVDIAHLELGDALHARDIVLPEGVRITKDPEDQIVSVLLPRAAPAGEAEEEIEEAEAITQPELIGEKKEEGGTAEE